jgi:hypothetical protein
MRAEAEETAEHSASKRIAQTDGSTQTYGLNVRGGGEVGVGVGVGVVT